MKSSSVLLAAGAALVAVTMSACEGLKAAMTAHVDTVARAGSQELSVDRLVTLMNAAKVPPNKDVAKAIANAWMDYQVLGVAAAKGDTNISSAAIDSAMWTTVAGMEARKYYDSVSKTWHAEDTAGARKMYNDQQMLAASHILFLTKGKPDSAKASAKKQAESLRGKLTAANFADMAKKYSQDPGSAARGGMLGAFPKGSMVPQFEKALLALKPGEISPVIETEYGYHILRRPTYDEVKDQFVKAASGHMMQSAESTFVTNLQNNGKIDVHKDAGATARTVIADPDAHLKDGTVLATSSAGSFTAGRLAHWIGSLPPQAVAQEQARLQSAADSDLNKLVKQFVTNELVIQAANKAGFKPSAQDLDQLHKSFLAGRDAAWMQLHIDPKSLADSAKSETERERLAAARVNTYVDKLVGQQAQYVQVPDAVSRLLRNEYGASINNDGLDHAVEKAVKAHLSADSARQATEPPTAVPMPGSVQPGAAGATPAPAPAAGAKAKPQPR